MFVKIGKNVKAHHTVRSYGKNDIGDDSIILDNVILGFPSTTLLLKFRQVDLNLEHANYNGCSISRNAIIRSETVIYCNVKIDHHVRTGHHVVIRENTKIGHNVMIGTGSVIDNNCKIGNHVSVQSFVCIPTGTMIEDYVFLGPHVTITNDRYPVRIEENLRPARIKRGASVGANSIILCGTTVGEGAFVAAGAVVTKDVPAWHMAIGTPARFKPLPRNLKKLNQII